MNPFRDTTAAASARQARAVHASCWLRHPEQWAKQVITEYDPYCESWYTRQTPTLGVNVSS